MLVIMFMEYIINKKNQIYVIIYVVNNNLNSNVLQALSTLHMNWRGNDENI